MKSRRLKLLAPLLAFAVVAAGCGDNDDDAAEPAEEPADEPTEEPAEEPSDEPAEEPSDEPAEEPSEEPAEEPADPPATDGDAIVVTGPERDESEAGSLQAVLGAWGEENGVEVQYLGSANIGHSDYYTSTSLNSTADVYYQDYGGSWYAWYDAHWPVEWASHSLWLGSW